LLDLESVFLETLFRLDTTKKIVNAEEQRHRGAKKRDLKSHIIKDLFFLASLR